MITSAPTRKARAACGSRWDTRASTRPVSPEPSKLWRSAQEVTARSKDFGDDPGNVRVRRAVVDEAGSQRKAAGDRRIRQVDAAALDEALEDRRVAAVEIAVCDAGPVAEAHRAELDRRHQLQLRRITDHARQIIGMPEIRADGRPECLGAVVTQRQPEFQRTEAA